ncbi:hypothetical protein [Arenimonas sp.]|uniref:hypothetical protein n=1 Tax=Arenimonas sp. TaxID=1872635 RepID=UPI0039E227A1
MFKSRTLFVVGAGASAELGLPVGAGLKSQIADKLNFSFQHGYELTGGDWRVYEALRSLAQEKSQNSNIYVQAGRRIHTGMQIAPSIDTFLDAHKEDGHVVACGKLGIASAILEAESNSKLFKDYRYGDKPEMERAEGTWLPALASRMVEGVGKGDLESIFNNLSFVCFNYDRCIELYLYHALQDYYGISNSQAAELMKKLPIRHPYGVVGRLPWQEGEGIQVPFGSTLEGTGLLQVSERIKTFTERIDEGDQLESMKMLVQKAQTVVFLGFSFQAQNMDLLSVTDKSSADRVFSTAYGFSNSDCAVISSEVRRALMKHDGELSVELRNTLKCVDLFGEYSKSITQ